MVVVFLASALFYTNTGSVDSSNGNGFALAVAFVLLALVRMNFSACGKSKEGFVCIFYHFKVVLLYANEDELCTRNNHPVDNKTTMLPSLLHDT